MRGGEQPAVERRDAQVAGVAARVRQPCHRPQRVPQPRRRRGSLREIAQRLEAVTLAIHRMPERHELARLREQQKEHPIDDRQRLFEAVADRRQPRGGPAGDERLQHIA